MSYCFLAASGLWKRGGNARSRGRDGQKASMSVSDSRENDSVVIDLLANINR